MKKFKTAAAVITAVLLFAGCGKNETEEISVSDIEPAESNSQTADHEDVTENTDELSETSETELTGQSEESSAADTDITEKNSSEPLAVYDNNLETYCFIPENDGNYTFKHSGADNIPWQVYILNEEFSDGIRYLYSNYEPNGETEFSAHLTSGQYVYLICRDNEWNSADYADTAAEIYYMGE